MEININLYGETYLMSADLGVFHWPRWVKQSHHTAAPLNDWTETDSFHRAVWQSLYVMLYHEWFLCMSSAQASDSVSEDKRPLLRRSHLSEEGPLAPGWRSAWFDLNLLEVWDYCGRVGQTSCEFPNTCLGRPTRSEATPDAVEVEVMQKYAQYY